MPSSLPVPLSVPTCLGLEGLVSSGPGVSAQVLLDAAEVRVVAMALEAGAEVKRHTNPRRALIQLRTGEAEFFYADAWHVLPAGAWLHLPPGHPHALRASRGAFSFTLTLCAAERGVGADVVFSS